MIKHFFLHVCTWLLLFLCSPCLLQSQSQSPVFAPLGAIWTYNSHNESYTKPYGAGQYRYKVAKDTIINGWNARIVECEIWTNGMFVSNPPMRRFVSTVGDKVYHLVDSSFVILYDFSAHPGDTIFSAVKGFSTFPNPGYEPPSYRIDFSYIIDSIGTIEVAGNILRTQFIHSSDDVFSVFWQIKGENTYPSDPIIERIGCYPSALWFGSGIIVVPPEGMLSSLRCYRDNDLYFEGNTLGIPCDSVLDVTTPEKIQFSVRPNPFLDEIRLHIPPSFDEFLQFRLFDLTGKMVLQKPVISGVNIINTTELPNAFYFWEIRQGIAVLGSGKVVK